MTLQRITVDTSTLPAALLEPVKEHLRVRHTRDDALITGFIAAALGLLERKCNVSLFAASYLATADELRGGVALPWPKQPAYTLPLNNVHTVTVTDDAEPPVDQSDNFSVWNPDFGGSGSSWLVGVAGLRITPGWQLALDVGLEDVKDLAPDFLALVGRATGALYENREASVTLWADSWEAELAALWRPSA